MDRTWPDVRSQVTTDKAHKKSISHAHTHTQSKEKAGKPRAQSTGLHTEQPAAQSALFAPSP
eukprot:38992-Hanusia_phi.AAC.1